MKLHLLIALSLGFFAAGSSAQTATAQAPAGQPKLTSHNFTKDMTVYVSDFELEAQNVKVDKGGIVGQVRPGIIERPSKRKQQDPEAQAKKIVDEMSKDLIDDLQKAGYKAQRLAADDPRPTSGAWVHGVFTEVDEGNRMRRAIIGFGSGEAKMELYVTLADLSHPDQPLYDVAEKDNSGKKPGAAITMNPYAAAAKFVMEKNASGKTVKKTASAVSAEVVKHLKPQDAPAATH